MAPLVLLVDDNEDDCVLTSCILADLGYPLITAHDGQAALDLADRHLPAVILLDIVMPEIDGLEVARRLKQNSRTAAIPIVAVTCAAMVGDRDRVLAAGCDRYIRKPVLFEELIEAVEQHCKSVHWAELLSPMNGFF